MKISIYRKKWHIFLLASLLLFTIVVSTNLWKRIFVLSVVVLQGSKIEFNNRQIYLGLDYVYFENDDGSLEVQRVLPGFKGFDDGSFLTVHTEKPTDMKNLEDHCNVKPNDCEVRGGGNYIARSILLKKYPGTEPMYYSSFHSKNCNVYISYIGEVFGNVHKNFVDNFFELGCR